jgi:hypothetical protein
MSRQSPPPLDQVLGSAAPLDRSRIEGEGPAGRLPLTPDMLRHDPSGHIFGLTQNAGMDWRTDTLGGPEYVIVSTMGGVRSEHGEPIALGYHTGHWEIGQLVRGAAEALRAAGARLASAAAIDPHQVIMSPDAARLAGLTSTVVFPRGNLAPEGSVIKATAIDASVIGTDGMYRHRGPARVFADERDAIDAVKGTSSQPVRKGDVIVSIGMGPSGTGMQETAQITTALRYLPSGKHVALVTDGRFSGISTGACIGHVGPEALRGGPIGRVRDGDLIEIMIDRNTLSATVNLVGADAVPLDGDACDALLRSRLPHPGLAPMKPMGSGVIS